MNSTDKKTLREMREDEAQQRELQRIQWALFTLNLRQFVLHTTYWVKLMPRRSDRGTMA